MNTYSHPSWGQRALSLLLLLGFIALGYALVDQVWMRQRQLYVTHTERLLDRLQNLQRLAATRPELEQSIHNIRNDERISGYFLPPTQPTLAAAELQQRIKSLVEGAGGTLSSIQALPVTEEGGMVRVVVSVNTQGDMAMLQQTLHGLESQVPLLFVDNLDIYARPYRPRYADGRLATTWRIQLNSQFEVSGYLRKEGS